MRDSARPRVIISRCIEFEKVRWDGQIIRSDFVRRLIPHMDPITVCPEVEIGLGVPRDPIRIVKLGERLRLVQPSTGLDVTEKMQEFVDSFLDSIGEVDGFIMKSGSPTSGLGRIKVYPGLGKVAPIGKTAGFLGAEVKRRFPHLAVEDDGRLRNARIREHFLRKIFTLAWFREVRDSGKMNELVRFQTENKLLFKVYSQKELREMGRIVANRDRKPFAELVEDYSRHLYEALKRGPACKSYINVLTNALMYFSGLSGEEKEFFRGLLVKYREGKLPLSVPVGVVKSWIIRFQEPYLLRQSFFEPYPEELTDIEAFAEACEGRDLWKGE